VGLYPPVGSAWSPVRQQPRIRTKGKNAKVYLFGALEAQSDQLYAGFWARRNTAAFAEFLRDLQHAIPHGRLYIVLDNYGVHKSRATCHFLATEGQRITLVLLPTYSPWLNRIEMTWRLLKGRAATNQWRDSLDHVQHAFLRTTMGALGIGAVTLRRPHTLHTSKD
jgi:hypothetical protein